MLLLTATSRTQGNRPGDFCDAVEGELVVIFTDCRVTAHRDDLMRCREGCPARFFGLSTNQMTTTAMVRELRVTSDDYLLAMTGYAQNSGARAPRSMACYLAGAMIRAAAASRSGTVLGLAGGKLTTRSEPPVNWRGVLAGISAMGRTYTWTRRYDKALRAITEES